MEVVLYDQIAERETWPCGLYLFTDMERATPAMCDTAARLHAKLQEFPGRVLTLNHPTDHLQRFELLRALHEQGVNDFNVHRATEIDECVRYPAFLRYTDMHIGPSSGLLHSRTELEDRLAELVGEGHPVERLIAVEFTDTSDSDGVFLKFGVIRVGPNLFPGHMFAGTDWMLKRETDRRSMIGKLEVDFMRDFPYADQVMRAFETAKLQYGRIDFGVKDGRIQVWEINDNPKLGSSPIKRRWITRRKARRIGRPKRKAAFVDAMKRIDLNGGLMEFRID